MRGATVRGRRARAGAQVVGAWWPVLGCAQRRDRRRALLELYAAPLGAARSPKARRCSPASASASARARAAARLLAVAARAPLAHGDATPLGRLLNHDKDGATDEPPTMLSAHVSTLRRRDGRDDLRRDVQFVAVPLGAGYWGIMRYFILTSREPARDATTRTPARCRARR